MKLSSADRNVVNFEVSKAIAHASNQLRAFGTGPLPDALIAIMMNGGTEGNEAGKALAKSLEASQKPLNDMARQFRREGKRLLGKDFPLTKAASTEVAKAELDVGTVTNFANITGGQSLGYVSLDTRLARGTVRPSSFTLYQSLDKSAANQVVDYWAYAEDTGGALPGAAFAGYSSVGSGTLNTNAGVYALQNITLKLLVDGRAITTALAAQNNFVNVAEQETANAALSLLSSANWACYYGNPTLYPNQFQGLYQSIPAANVFDFNQFYTAGPGSVEGWSKNLALFNMIYEVSAQVTSYNTFGHITHAFMSPTAMGSLEGLTQTQLNNILNEFSSHQGRAPIWDNANLMGMRTRFGDIQFPIDLFITARNKAAQAILKPDGTNYATTTAPTKPVSVTAAFSATQAGSQFSGAYSSNGSGATYIYAVASMDSSMNESTLTYTAAITGVLTGGSVSLHITPPGAADAAVFRVYRSAVGLAASGTALQAPQNVRYIGEIAANGSTAVDFVDLNGHIPGSEEIFLLDMDESDGAVDYRYLLPLSRIDLFAQNLFTPWAVAAIGAIRNRIPKFHGIIKNYVPDNPVFDPTNSANI